MSDCLLAAMRAAKGTPPAARAAVSLAPAGPSVRLRKSTLAGGSAGTADGQGAAAQFNNLNIALGPDDCVYVGDQGNNAIRKVSRSGVVSTLAGRCDPDSTAAPLDGRGAAACFSAGWSITRIAVDAQGNVYVVDHTLAGLRKVDPDGVVSTLLTPADFAGDNPVGVAVDGAGNLYLTVGNRVLKRDAQGRLSTLAGAERADPMDEEYVDGPGEQARFSGLYGIAVAANGDLYVADTGNRRIRKIRPDGMVSSVGSELPKSPVGLAVDGAGHLYVADGGLRKFDAEGQPLVLLDGDGTPFSAASFGYASSVAVAADGCIYVGDAGYNRIERLLPVAAGS
jgi:sugar lactone lactonase YvrE